MSISSSNYVSFAFILSFYTCIHNLSIIQNIRAFFIPYTLTHHETFSYRLNSNYIPGIRSGINIGPSCDKNALVETSLINLLINNDINYDEIVVCLLYKGNENNHHPD